MKKPTDEQKAKAEARRAQFKQLAAQLGALTDEQRTALAAKLPTITNCNGHSLSPHNTIMLSYQREAVTMVGGYRQWQAAGRQVQLGEESMLIWVPKMKGKQSADEIAELSGFITASVFDVSQTKAIVSA